MLFQQDQSDQLDQFRQQDQSDQQPLKPRQLDLLPLEYPVSPEYPVDL
jgi:hypothetical protein